MWPVCEASRSTYRRRQPELTALHQAVLQGVPQFFDAADAKGLSVPTFVEKELQGYLKCGKLEYGFVRIQCRSCQYDRLVGFSCKGRGFCPSCGGRRMSELAIHLSERVLPPVPIRQFVLSLPQPLRYIAAYDRSFAGKVIRHFISSIFQWQRKEAKRRYGLSSVQDAHCGAVTVIQRFGRESEFSLAYHRIGRRVR